MAGYALFAALEAEGTPDPARLRSTETGLPAFSEAFEPVRNLFSDVPQSVSLPQLPVLVDGRCRSWAG